MHVHVYESILRDTQTLPTTVPSTRRVSKLLNYSDARRKQQSPFRPYVVRIVWIINRESLLERHVGTAIPLFPVSNSTQLESHESHGHISKATPKPAENDRTAKMSNYLHASRYQTEITHTDGNQISKLRVTRETIVHLVLKRITFGSPIRVYSIYLARRGTLVRNCRILNMDKINDVSTYPWLRHERPGRAGELCVLSHRSGCIFPQYKQVTSNTSHTLVSPLFDPPYHGDRFARFPFVTLKKIRGSYCFVECTE